MSDKSQQEEALLDAKFEPNTSSTPHKTRRPNKIALFLAGAMIFIGFGAFLAIDNQPAKTAAEDEKGDAADNAKTERLKALPNSVIEQPATAPNLPNAGIIAPSNSPDEPQEQVAPPSPYTPIPPRIETTSPEPNDRDAQIRDQIRQQKLQMLQQAVASPTSVTVHIERPPASQKANDNSAAVNAQIPTFDPSERPALPNEERERRWDIETKKTPQTTPYTLRTGFVIPAVLTVGMNSDMPGQTQALVSQNVYDTKTGRYLLIPQGTRLIGSYQSAPAYGSKRLSVLWERLEFPDGSAMDIGGMQGTDFAGMNGLKDQVNNHWWRTLTAAFLMSILQAPAALGGALSTASMGSGNSMMSNLASGGGNAAQMLASQTGSALSAPFAKDLNTSPTLIIRAGYALNVMVNKDLTFQSAYKQAA